jgi:CHASE3 domain sensor protein
MMIRKTALQVGFAASLALILWNGYVVISHVKQMRRIAALTLQISTIQPEISGVLKDLTDMEAGQSGYLLTNDPSFLQSSVEAKTRIADDFANLRGGLANRGEHERSVVSEVESLVNSKQSEMEHSITLRRQGYRHRAFKLVASTDGMDYLDKARAHLSSLSTAENSKLAEIETDRSAGVRKVLNDTIISSFALLVLATCLFVLVRYHGRALEQEAARSAQKLASNDFQLARLMTALSNEAQSKTSSIKANVRLLLQEYGGFLPRHAHECAEQIEEASAQLEQLRQDLIANSGSANEEGCYQAVA